MLETVCTLENKESPEICEIPYFLSVDYSNNHMENRTNLPSFGKTKTGRRNAFYKRT